MPKYLFQVSYTAEGVKGLQKDGGSKRRAVAQSLIESAGGKLEALYFAFGGTDVYVIADLPDNAAAATVSLTVGSSGAMTSKTSVLLSAEDLDKAVKKTLIYTPPGR